MNCSRPTLPLALAFALLTAFAAAPAFAQEAPKPADPPQNPPVITDPPPVVVVETPEPPQEEPSKPRFYIGPDIGYYIPTSDKARRAFGDKFVTIGFGLGAAERISEKGRIALDFSVISNRIAESSVMLAPIGVAYARALTTNTSVTPYVGVSLNFYVANIRSERGDFEVKSGYRGGFGGTAFAGVTLGKQAFLRARYCLVSKISGFDLSGLSLTAGYRFAL